jgi:hypothetical protein
MAFCGKCGASVAEGVSFCGRCGSPMQTSAGIPPIFPPPPQPPPPQYNYPTTGTGTAPNLMTRVTNIITKPKEEWPVIAGESTSVASLYTGYIIPLAAIPAVATFIQMAVIGYGFFRIPMATALIATIVSYALGLGGIYLGAVVIDKLAPNFQSQPNFLQALKLVAYASTASWIAGIFNILPLLGILAIFGALYGIYLFYVGLPVMMRTPQDKVIVYMIVSAVVIIVITVIIAVLVGLITAPAMMGTRILG